MKKHPSRTPTPLNRLTVATLLVLAMQAAIAQTHSFNLPAQPLDQALTQFARQAGLQLAAAPELLRGLRGQPAQQEILLDLLPRRVLQGRGAGCDVDCEVHLLN